MVLTGDNYTDLIMSNYIAGALLGHMLIKIYPGMQFNKDYMYGSIFAQLLQENLATELYESSSDLIAPSPLQASVMGSGQGGPYQINNYAADMVGNPQGGYALANYVAIQKNIGYTLSTQSAQVSKATPPIFNNKYYGPVLTAFFHLNDLRALSTLEDGSAAPNYPKCMANLVNIANNPLEIIMNYAYNQGYTGGLVNTITNDCVNKSASVFLTQYNSYNNASGSSYNQYPYQVRFYLDELYNQSTLLPQTNNHVAFHMTQLAMVFSKVFQTLAYINSSGSYVLITNVQANTAFSAALTTAKVPNTAILDLSDATQRTTIYSILDNAITNLENNLNTNFSAATLTQIGTGSGGTESGTITPTYPSNAPAYPNGIGSYNGASIVTAGSVYYKCISNQVAPWCNNATTAGMNAYAPGSDSAWQQAWTVYTCN